MKGEVDQLPCPTHQGFGTKRLELRPRGIPIPDSALPVHIEVIPVHCPWQHRRLRELFQYGVYQRFSFGGRIQPCGTPEPLILLFPYWSKLVTFK